MQITLGKMRKRPNSTKRTLSASTNVTVTLKESVTVEHPTFILHTDPSDYNYVVWGERYYYIDCNNVRILANNLWEVPCKIDRLATYRDLLRYGLSGTINYSTDSGLWDEFVDDLRFMPTYLRRTTSLAENINYLHTNSNVFGLNPIGTPKMWDCTWSQGADEVYHMSSIGEGLYVLGVNSDNHGKHVYVLNEHGMNNLLTARGFWGLVKTDLKTVEYLIWMPLQYGVLRDNIPVANRTDDPEIWVGSSSTSFILSDSADKSMEIHANPCIIMFTSEMDYPKVPDDVPYFCYNNRWNTIQLNTPSGSTSINLDRIYPYPWAGRKLAFNTTFDILSGVINTKYVTDTEYGFSDGAASVIYESNMNIGLDVLGLIDKVQYKSGDNILKAAGAGALVGLGIVGVASGVGAIPGIAATAIGSGALTGVNQLKSNFTNTNTSEFTMQLSNNLAAFYNTVQLGMISLRLKPYTCKEFLEAPSSPLLTYKAFCAKYGYPSNKFLSSDQTFSYNGEYYKFRDVHLNTSNGYAMIDGMSEDDINYLLDTVVNTGVWLEQ